ncbi:MAG: hypothetical protein GXO21_07950 [Aquificae bacterium]|nr:hypothetical protein [Aquificota bacterium]
MNTLIERKIERKNGNGLTTKEIVAQLRLLFPHLKNVADVELMKAVAVAKHLGLNPLKKEVHFVPFNGSVQLIVGYTEYIKRAERSGKLDGWLVKTGKDEFGRYAEVIIWRKDWSKEFSWKVYEQEVRQNSPTWKKMPLFMLRKVAIAQAFRLAFPEETAELPYEETEMGIITSSTKPTFTTNTQPHHEEEFEETTPEEIFKEEKNNTNGNGNGKATQAQIGYIHKLLKEKKIPEGFYREFLKEHYGVESSKDLTKQQASELIEELKKMPIPSD